MKTKLQKIMKVINDLKAGDNLVVKVKSTVSMDINIVRTSEYIFSAHVGGHNFIKNKPLSHIETFLESIVNDKHTNIFLSGIKT